MRKTMKKILEENRCQGFGEDYTPLYLAEEARSDGYAARFFDPLEGRMVHTLSQTETNLYLQIRGDPNVKHIREQYLLKDPFLHEVMRDLGIRNGGRNFTTDCVVDYKDGTQCAFSVKWKQELFDSSSLLYRGREGKYVKLIDHMMVEKTYWECQGTAFYIVTEEMLNTTFASNIETLLKVWKETEDPNLDRMTLYLVAHGVILTDLSETYLDPKKIRKSISADIPVLYADCIRSEERRMTWLANV